MNFAKFLRTPFLKNTSERLLLEVDFETLVLALNVIHSGDINKIPTYFKSLVSKKARTSWLKRKEDNEKTL